MRTPATNVLAMIGLLQPPSHVPEGPGAINPGKPLGVLDALAAVDPQGKSASARVGRARYPLRFYGDPVLEQRCSALGMTEEVPLVVVDAMRRVLSEKNGLGIAANQVGDDRRLAILLIDGERVLVINPRVKWRHPDTKLEREGSLSLPGLYFTVRRPIKVTIGYEDERRKPQLARLQGQEARIALHLIDTLDGLLLPENLTRQQRRQAERVGDKARGLR